MPSVKLNGLLVSLKTKTCQRRLQLAPSSTDHKSGAAGRAEPQHCSNVSETRVILVVRGLLLLLKLLALAPSSCPWTSSNSPSIPLQQLLAGCRLLRPHTPWPHKPCKLLTRASPPSPRWHQWRHLSSVLIWWACGWQGALMTVLGVCLVWIELFQLSRNATKLSFSHHLWKNAQCSWSHSAGVWQKMSSNLCYWDTWGHLFCIVMERAFLVSRMLAAVTSNPESGLFDQCKPPWTWNLTFCLRVAQDEIWFGEKKQDFYLD